MDGKRPEASGGSRPAGDDVQADQSPLSSRASSAHDEGTSTRCETPNRTLTGTDTTLPLLNWDLFRDFSLSSENAAYTLHDGFGRFLDAAGEIKSIWYQKNGELSGKSIFDLVEDPISFKAWFSCLELPQNQEEATVKTIRHNGSSNRISLKRIPLFVGICPEQTRIVLKAVATPASEIKDCWKEDDTIFRFSCEADGSLKRADKAFIELLCLEAADLKTINLLDSIHSEDLDRFSKLISNNERPFERDLRQVRLKVGQEREHSLLLHGQPTSSGWSFRAVDITLQKSGIRAVLDNLNNGLPGRSIAIIGQPAIDSPFIASNLVFEMETGFSRNEFIKKSFLDLQGEATDGDAATSLKSALENQTDCEREIYLYRKNNDGFWARVRILPLRDSKGSLRGSAIALENVTRERETQSVAIQQEILRSLGQMASGIAHDFNNLLAPILGFSELLLKMPEDGRDNQKLVSFLEKIKVAAQDGAAVVNRLQEFYRSQDQETEVAVDIDPNTLAQQVKDLTQHRWKSQAEASGVDIDFSIIVETDRQLHANEPEIRQALSNLVLNAADAIKKDGSITLSIKDFQNQVSIQIIDTGKGMSEKEILKCQDPFYSTKGKSGTGLGLSIVSNIVKRHGGDFRIESKKGAGSTVTLLLPAKDVANEKTEPLI